MKKYFLQILCLISLIFSGYFVNAQTVTFNASGSWACPSNVTSVLVECWGGGGGGGASSINGFGAGGGAGSSYSSIIMTVIPGNNYTYTVGAGGAGGAGFGGPAKFGEASWFNDSTIVLAKGGAPGAAASAGVGGSGGLGSSVGNTGTTIFAGGSGGNGDGTISGAGGGSAGSLGAGGDASMGTPGAAGNGGGAAGPSGVSSSAGIIGNAPGSGGSGAHKGPVGFGTLSGKAGGAGQIKLTYNVPTPVVFEYFKGKKTDDANQLEWKVNNSEPETVTMILEHSVDGKKFDPLEKQLLNKEITGKAYTYNDYGFKAGLNFYRVTLQYANGQTTYSKTVTLVGGKINNAIHIAPNPVKDRAILQINTPYNESATVIISDITGKKLFSKSVNISSGENNIDVDFTAFKSGMYQITVTGPFIGKSNSIRFVKN